MRDKSDEEIPPPKKLKTGKGKRSKTAKKEVQGKKPEDGNDDDDKLPDIPL